MSGVIPVHEGLFTADPPRLVGSHCDACGGYHFPRHRQCPYCSTPGAAAVELSPTGSLWAFTAVTAPPPGYRGEIPYGFGVVQLPEGIRIITRLTESDPARLIFGQPVRLVIVPLHQDDDGNEVVTYAFTADGPRQAHPQGSNG